MTLTASGVCNVFPKDTPIELKGNVAVLTFTSTNVIAVGQVIGRRHAGRTFRLWNESVY